MILGLEVMVILALAENSNSGCEYGWIYHLGEYQTWQVMKDYKGPKREDNSLVNCKIWIRRVQNPPQSLHLMILTYSDVTQITSRTSLKCHITLSLQIQHRVFFETESCQIVLNRMKT